MVNPMLRAYILAVLKARLVHLAEDEPEGIIIRACIRSLEEND